MNKQHHEDDGPHKSFKQGKLEKHPPPPKGFEHHKALFNPSSENGKPVAQLQRPTAQVGESVRRKKLLVLKLHKSGFHGRVARGEPLLTESNKKSHLQFAMSHVGDTANIGEDGVFSSDEAKIELFLVYSTCKMPCAVKNGALHVNLYAPWPEQNMVVVAE